MNSKPRGVPSGGRKGGAPPLPPPNSYIRQKTNKRNHNKRKPTWRNAKTHATANKTTATDPATAPTPTSIEPCYASFHNNTITCRSEDPTLAWNHVLSKSTAPCLQVSSVVPRTLFASPRAPETLRVVCISDTHGKHRRMTKDIPAGDVLIHAGDFTNCGHTSQIKDFCKWMAGMPHTHKILICGNHDITCDKDYYNGTAKNGQASWKRFHHNGKNDDVAARRALRETKNLIYLEDESIVIDGYSFYGSPWQPEFCDWAFNLDRGYPCKMMWDKIPTATDILITHGPPVGHGDMVSQHQRAGCVDLLSAVTERIRPLYHVFGHVHEGYGVTTNQTTTFINASTCTLSYRPNNAPIVFDLPRKNLNTIPSTKMESNNSGIIKISAKMKRTIALLTLILGSCCVFLLFQQPWHIHYIFLKDSVNGLLFDRSSLPTTMKDL